MAGRNLVETSVDFSDFDDFFQWPGIGDAESKCRKLGQFLGQNFSFGFVAPSCDFFLGWLSSKKLDIGQPGADLAPGVELWGAPGAPGDGTKGGEKMSGCRAKME